MGIAMKRITIRVGLQTMVAAGWWVQKVPAQAFDRQSSARS